MVHFLGVFMSFSNGALPSLPLSVFDAFRPLGPSATCLLPLALKPLQETESGEELWPYPWPACTSLC